jgi:hypothetical protein
VGVNGQQTGPFDLSALAAQARSGQLAATALVWKPGMAAWAAASQIAELAAHFPPPMPSPPPMPPVPGSQ